VGFEQLLSRKPEAEKKEKAKGVLKNLVKHISTGKKPKPVKKPQVKKKTKPVKTKKVKAKNKKSKTARKASKKSSKKIKKAGKPAKKISKSKSKKTIKSKKLGKQVKPKETTFSSIVKRAEKKISSPKYPLQTPTFEEHIPSQANFNAIAASPKAESSAGFNPAAVERALAKAEVIETTLGIPAKRNSIERVPTGIDGLNELIEGGFEKGSSVLLVGSAGTGKTLFSLQFLYNGAIKYNEPGVFISFEEEKESLYRHSSAFGFDFEALEKKDLFRVLEYKPHQVEKLMKEGGGPIRDAIREMGAKRLVIDSITSYGLLFKDEYQKRETILDFFEMLHKWGCTSMIISELPPKVAEVKEGSVGFLTDAIISLYYSKEEEKGIRVHSCEILKMRGTSHTNKLLAVGFESNGIKIYPEVEVF